jgi:hypothetical protein
MPENNPICFTDTKEKEAASSRWIDLLGKLEGPTAYSEHRFNNEVLGLSDSQGARLISLEELRALCTGPELNRYSNAQLLSGVTQTFGGVDWGGGGISGKSLTVMWVWGYRPGHTARLRTLFYKVYPGNNPVDDVDDIAQIFGMYNVQRVCGDAGGGFLANTMLAQKLGHDRVIQIQYGSGAKPAAWNNVDRYLVNRTVMIDNFLMSLKNKQAEYGPASMMQSAIDDVLSVHEELTTFGKKIWTKFPDKTDDCLHAQIYGWLAAKISLGDLQFVEST